MKITSSLQNFRPNYTLKPAFGCKFCDAMLDELKNQDAPRKESIHWLDTCLIDIMSHNAETTQKLYPESPQIINDESANHLKAAQTLHYIFTGNIPAVVEHIKMIHLDD